MNKIFPQQILIFLFALVAHAEIEFAPGGGFVENGRPVQLIGNLIYELPTADDYRAFPGEPSGWEWLYETPPNQAQFDRSPRVRARRLSPRRACNAPRLWRIIRVGPSRQKLPQPTAQVRFAA